MTPMVVKFWHRLEIDIGALRKNVFDKKAEVENIIEDFKAQLDKEWDELQKNKKELQVIVIRL